MARNTEKEELATAGDPRWAALIARDPSADGEFFYAVVTTGIYCRPSCGARTARPENVVFHRSAADAERAGFRPCKRCRPDLPSRQSEDEALVARLCRLIEESEIFPDLNELGRHAGRSVSHVHRLFKKTTGLTPKAYAAAHRARRVRDELGRRDSVTEAIYGAGYNSSGRFYEQANHMLGMTPTAYRSGGAGTEIRFAVGECSLGAILVAAGTRGICAIALGDDPEQLVRDLQDRFPQAIFLGGDAAFEQHVARVVALVEAPGLGLELPLDIRGTAFQQRVWQALQQIPPGATASYAEIAERIGQPKAIRAVARACAANVLAVAIPCHRIVGKDGGLSGYRWGVERKAALLARERKNK
ncbi:MAG TPA: bifunctional DNA-binding transcriptional regulator/O6-methylguanine-DNA methyltransferase Ada [Desulfobulbaceae bacterium]|nr:bifunctional DNA-binding transcriptional regulator/O6-methylguanine-DNA methyltransferase Ada [Desulfobulbaceae bacterium]